MYKIVLFLNIYIYNIYNSFRGVDIVGWRKFVSKVVVLILGRIIEKNFLTGKIFKV